MRSLQDLFSDADRLIELEKVIKTASSAQSPTATPGAPTASSSEVNSVISQIEKCAGDSSLAGLDDFEKVAVVMNQIHADTQLDELDRVFRFQESAYEEGHMNAHVEEALEKVAAGRLKRRLVDFVAVSAAMASGKGEDANSGKNGKPTPSGERPMASPSAAAARTIGE